MACTTIKLQATNRVVGDRWSTYCQAIHVHKLVNAKPKIDFGGGGQRRQHQQHQQHHDKNKKNGPHGGGVGGGGNSSKRREMERERELHIQRGNDNLLKKILEIERSSKARIKARARKKKSRIKAAKFKLRSAEQRRDAVDKEAAIDSIEQASMSTEVLLLHSNRVFARSSRIKRDRERIARENEHIMKRLLSTKATISAKGMDEEAKRRGKIIKSMSGYQQNKVLDLSHLTLQAIQSGTTDINTLKQYNLAPTMPASPRPRPDTKGGVRKHRVLKKKKSNKAAAATTTMEGGAAREGEGGKGEGGAKAPPPGNQCPSSDTVKPAGEETRIDPRTIHEDDSHLIGGPGSATGPVVAATPARPAQDLATATGPEPEPATESVTEPLPVPVAVPEQVAVAVAVPEQPADSKPEQPADSMPEQPADSMPEQPADSSPIAKEDETCAAELARLSLGDS